MNYELELPPIAAYQQRAMFSNHRGSVIEATTKAGKTFGCMLWLLTEKGRVGGAGHEFWWVAPVYDQTKIAYRRFTRMLREADPTGGFASFNNQDLSITFADGSIIRCKSADKPDNLYGEDVYAAVFDEATRAKPEAWHALRSTLTATRGRVRIIGNVKGRHNWAYTLARKAESGQLPEWTYAKITADDAVAAGIIEAAEVAEAQTVLPDKVFRELYYAEPSDDGGNPFGLAHIAGCAVPALSTSNPVCWGVDLAKSVDWTVAIGLDVAGSVCRFERWQAPWAVTKARLRTMLAGAPALIDSTGVGDPIVEELQRLIGGVAGFKFTQQTKQQIMEGLAVAIQQRAVTFPDGPIKVELETFEYEYTRTGVRYCAPEGFHDDCVCALALAVAKYKRGSGGVLVRYEGDRYDPDVDPHAELNRRREAFMRGEDIE